MLSFARSELNRRGSRADVGTVIVAIVVHNYSAAIRACSGSYYLVRIRVDTAILQSVVVIVTIITICMPLTFIAAIIIVTRPHFKASRATTNVVMIMIRNIIIVGGGEYNGRFLIASVLLPLHSSTMIMLPTSTSTIPCCCRPSPGRPRKEPVHDAMRVSMICFPTKYNARLCSTSYPPRCIYLMAHYYLHYTAGNRVDQEVQVFYETECMYEYRPQCCQHTIQSSTNGACAD
jgi:hypothetical protein